VISAVFGNTYERPVRRFSEIYDAAAYWLSIDWTDRQTDGQKDAVPLSSVAASVMSEYDQLDECDGMITIIVVIIHFISGSKAHKNTASEKTEMD